MIKCIYNKAREESTENRGMRQGTYRIHWREQGEIQRGERGRRKTGHET